MYKSDIPNGSIKALSKSGDLKLHFVQVYWSKNPICQCLFIKTEYQENPEKVWKTDVFGKPLASLVSDEITTSEEREKTFTSMMEIALEIA